MDLNTVEDVLSPRARAELPQSRPGDAYLAGGTWMFSEPQIGLRRLIDLTSLGWPPLTRTGSGLEIAATCTLNTLERYDAPAGWPAAALFAPCCRALVGSFKIRGQATIGGNICLALPAAPMAALAVALHADCVIWREDGTQYTIAASDVITGAQTTALAAGEILRSVHISESFLKRAAAYRQISLTPLGRSAALLIGIPLSQSIELTITAAVAAPCQVTVPLACTPDNIAALIDAAVPVWYDDAHGRPVWRRHVTHLLACEILEELA